MKAVGGRVVSSVKGAMTLGVGLMNLYNSHASTWVEKKDLERYREWQGKSMMDETTSVKFLKFTSVFSSPDNVQSASH